MKQFLPIGKIKCIAHVAHMFSDMNDECKSLLKEIIYSTIYEKNQMLKWGEALKLHNSHRAHTLHVEYICQIFKNIKTLKR